MSNVGPQLVRQVVRAALWLGLATVRSSCARKAALPSRVAGRRISRRSRPGCPSVGGPLTVTFSPRIECAVLALHRRCEKEVQRERPAVHRPFKARWPVRPSATSGQSVRLATVHVRSPLEPRALPMQRLCTPANRQSLSSESQGLRCRPVWLPSANARSSLPRLAVAQPVDRADVLKRAAHALARRSSPTLGATN